MTPADQRAEDLDLLAALARADFMTCAEYDEGTHEDVEEELEQSLTEEEHRAFDDMLTKLRRGGALSDKQRAWAESAAARLGLDYGDPARRNKAVPRGAEVETPAVLRMLPKAPPGRRAPR